MAGYPAAYQETTLLPDGTPLFIRPIRRGDWRLLQWGFRQLPPEDVHYRFLGGLARLTEERARRLAAVDYDAEIAFLAFSALPGEKKRGAGVVRLARPARGEEAEIAFVLLPGWKRRGVGERLAAVALRWARANGIRRVTALMLQDNSAMRHLATHLGFTLSLMPEEPSLLRAELEI